MPHTEDFLCFGKESRYRFVNGWMSILRVAKKDLLNIIKNYRSIMRIYFRDSLFKNKSITV